MSMKVNPFQQKALQGLQKTNHQQGAHKPAATNQLQKTGNQNNPNTLNAGGLQKPQQSHKADAGQPHKNFGQNVKELERLQKLGDQKNFSKTGAQQDPNEMAKALSQTNIPGQKLNLMA